MNPGNEQFLVRLCAHAIRWGCFAFILAAACDWARAVEVETTAQLQQLKNENNRLQGQLLKQQELLNALNAKVSRLERTSEARASEARFLRNEIKSPPSDDSAARINPGRGKITLSGQAAVGFFETGSEGQNPNAEFRVDEARLFLDAQVWDDVYAFTELNILTREQPDENVHLGEVYVDFEHVLKRAGLDPLLNIRAGRFYIPFGEEYQVRYPIDNPLISHSLGDLWGVDEGIELYGAASKVQYAVAVQNGGNSALHDFAADKSVAGRISYDPVRWLHLSASGMRTGDLSAKNDQLSELWFGNGFLRALGSTATRFNAELAEGDAQLRFRRGHVKAAGGYLHYADNDLSNSNARDVYYYSAEGVLNFTSKFFGAARFSQILADKGFPIVGNGHFAEYLFQTLTKDLWRLSLGAGYRPNPNLVLKLEYSFERGQELGGDKRDHENFFGAQAALRF